MELREGNERAKRWARASFAEALLQLRTGRRSRTTRHTQGALDCRAAIATARNVTYSLFAHANSAQILLDRLGHAIWRAMH